MIELAVERKEDPEDSESEEDDSTSQSEDEVEEIEFMPKSKRGLVEAFKNLYSKFHDDIEEYNNLVLMLDELKRRECIEEDEYKSLNKALQQKIGLGLEETIQTTTSNLTRNDKQQITRLLKRIKKDELVEKVQRLMTRYFNGEKKALPEILEILPRIEDKVKGMRLKIILNEIRKTTDRVFKILYRLTGAEDKSEVLRELQRDGYITEDQFHKLSIAPNKISSFSKIIQGRGMYLKGT